jgi:hypothetical protein
MLGPANSNAQVTRLANNYKQTKLCFNQLTNAPAYYSHSQWLCIALQLQLTRFTQPKNSLMFKPQNDYNLKLAMW